MDGLLSSSLFYASNQTHIPLEDRNDQQNFNINIYKLKTY